LFEGIIALSSLGYAHIDIKPTNIVYNKESEKAAIIDFGLTHLLKKLYIPSNKYIFKHPYAYYPPEFIALEARMESAVQLSLLFIVEQNLERNLNEFHRELKFLKIKQLVNEWNEVIQPSRNALVTFLKSIKTKLIDGLRPYGNKIDVYMLGVTIAKVFALSYNAKKLVISTDKEPFYKGLFKLIQGMTDFNPVTRYEPSKCYEEYKNLVALLAQTSKQKSIEKEKTEKIFKEKHSQLKVRKEKKPKECPEGKIINPVTGRCIKDPSIKIEKPKKECPEGKIINPVTGRCIKDPSIKIEKPKKECPPGKVLNPITGRCNKIKSKK
jgi:serine/threonine protein kinase